MIGFTRMMMRAERPKVTTRTATRIQPGARAILPAGKKISAMSAKGEPIALRIAARRDIGFGSITVLISDLQQAGEHHAIECWKRGHMMAVSLARIPDPARIVRRALIVPGFIDEPSRIVRR